MNDRLLKNAFLADGLGSLASAALLVVGADLLTRPLGLGTDFLTTTGWLLLPCAALFLWIARTGSRTLAATGVLGNLVWVLASAVAIPILQPTMLGAVIIAAQAAAVLAIAALEYRGLRRAQAVAG